MLRFFATLCINSLGNRLHGNELHVEGGSLFLKPFHLRFAIFAFVMFHPFVVVFSPEPEHAIQEAGQVMGQGGDRFGRAQPGTEAAVLSSQRALAVM